MKLRKDQRYTAYCIMLAEIDEHWDNENNEFRKGFCFLIWDLFAIETKGASDNTDYNDIRYNTSFFPELAEKRTFDTINGWPYMEDLITRKELLKQCIKETENF